MYLMIRNPGVCPKECFTLLGVSTTRYSGSADTIGTFGPGKSHAINLCLKNNIPPVIFCGNLRLEPFSKPKVINDGLTECTFGQVCFNVTGKDEGRQVNKIVETGFVQEYGQDWTSLDMGLREFVSNALDRTVRETGSWDKVEIDVVADKSVRAKTGHTSIFVPFTGEVQKFYNELAKRFLHFSEAWNIKNEVLPKSNRSLDGSGAMIFKKGVFVRQLRQPSLFDYNLNSLELDESRNSSEYDVRVYAARALSRSNCLNQVFDSFKTNKVYWEHEFSHYDLNEEENFLKLWPQKHVACLTDISAERIRRKGYSTIIVPLGWFKTLRNCKVPVDQDFIPKDLLDKDEVPPTEEMLSVTNKLWSMLESFNLTKSRSLPQIKGFNPIMDSEAQVQGLYVNETIYLHRELSGKILYKTILEELTHHITQSTDMSRDFQDYLLTLLTEIIT